MADIEMFAVGCKTSSAAVDFNAKLGPYLADELGEDPQKFSAAVTQLGAARAMVAGTTAKVEPSEPMVQKLMTYIGQLGALKKHFPINQGEKVGVHPSAFSPRRHLFLELLTPGLTRPVPIGLAVTRLASVHARLGMSQGGSHCVRGLTRRPVPRAEWRGSMSHLCLGRSEIASDVSSSNIMLGSASF